MWSVKSWCLPGNNVLEGRFKCGLRSLGVSLAIMSLREGLNVVCEVLVSRLPGNNVLEGRFKCGL